MDGGTNVTHQQQLLKKENQIFFLATKQEKKVSIYFSSMYKRHRLQSYFLGIDEITTTTKSKRKILNYSLMSTFSQQRNDFIDYDFSFSFSFPGLEWFTRLRHKSTFDQSYAQKQRKMHQHFRLLKINKNQRSIQRTASHQLNRKQP